MALKKRDCVHNSSLCLWDDVHNLSLRYVEDVHNLSLRYVEDVHNLSLKKRDCPELVTEIVRLSRSLEVSVTSSGQSHCFSDKFWTVLLFQRRVVDTLHISQ